MDATARIRQNGGLISVETLPAHYHLSQRHFERLFKEYTGLTPRFYARILRFETALSLFPGTRSLMDIALECGYFDQPHLVHDCQEFTGMSPRQYREILRWLIVPPAGLDRAPVLWNQTS